METTVRVAVINRINSLLAKHGITLYKLAKQSNVPYGTLKNIMSAGNENKAVNLSTAIQIAQGFGMTISEFLDDPTFNEDNLTL